MSHPIRIEMSADEWEKLKLVWNSDKAIPEHEAVRLLVELRAASARAEPPSTSIYDRAIPRSLPWIKCGLILLAALVAAFLIAWRR